MFALGLFLMPLYRGETKVDTVNSSPQTTVREIQMIKNEFKNKRCELMNAKVISIDGASLTVLSGENTINVNLRSTTHYRRKFWGVSSRNEIKVGDSLDIVGRWLNDEKTELTAVVIRNVSVQKRAGVFFGRVKALGDSGFIVTTINKGEETVIVDDTVEVINREGGSINISEITLGHNIRVRGVWDGCNNTITEITEIKDFSLPLLKTSDELN